MTRPLDRYTLERVVEIVERWPHTDYWPPEIADRLRALAASLPQETVPSKGYAGPTQFSVTHDLMQHSDDINAAPASGKGDK